MRMVDDRNIPSQYYIDGAGASIERLKKSLYEGALVSFATSDPDYMIESRVTGVIVKKYDYWVLMEIFGKNDKSFKAGYSYFDLLKGRLRYGP